MVDILDIVEYIQLCELIDSGVVYDRTFVERREFLAKLIDSNNINIDKYKNLSENFSNDTGFLKKQRCTNKECGFIFYSEDIANTCDICYHPTLRLLD